MGPDEVSAGEIVPEMAVDGVDEEQFAVCVPIMAPGIRGSASQSFEDCSSRVIAPDGAAQGDAPLGGRAGGADLSRAGSAASAIQPAVGAEMQAVGEVVVILGRNGEAIQDNLGRTIWHVITVAV